jgi:hypothetical protein
MALSGLANQIAVDFAEAAGTAALDLAVGAAGDGVTAGVGAGDGDLVGVGLGSGTGAGTRSGLIRGGAGPPRGMATTLPLTTITTMFLPIRGITLRTTIQLRLNSRTISTIKIIQTATG